MKIPKKPFYITTVGSSYSMYYRSRNLRHQFIKWCIEKYGYDNNMPDGEWIVTLVWRRSVIFGLRFREA